ncbi:MAG: hypothetical protein OXI33_01430 [Chloroflexota bacterium]|nr:hypothetical protein [Chloroflexota bacterium]
MDDKKILMQRLAIIRRIAKLAKDPGKTSIQKIVYFLQSGLEVPLGYRFKMHHYGPYSDKLDGNLSLSDAMGIVEIKADSAGYGYHITPGKFQVEDVEPSMTWEEIDETIMNLAELELPQLELLATIHFVQSIRSRWDRKRVIMTVRRLKPKFSEPRIEKAYRDIEKMGFIKS